MFPASARVRQCVLVVAAVLTGGLLLLLREPGNTGHAALSPLPTLTPVCLPLLGGNLSLSEAGYVLDGNGHATLSLSLQNQDTVDLTLISFSAAGWTPLAPTHGAIIAGLLGDHLVSWYTPAGRLEFTPIFTGYRLGATERFTFTVQNFIPSQPIQLTVRKGENVLETHMFDLSAPACDHTPAPFSPLPTPTPTPVGGVVLPTEPQVASCVFEPPSSGIPAEPIIPLSAYSFSEPQVALTHTAPIAIQQWLPDSETLLVSRESSVSQTVSVELVNTVTGVITQVVEPRRYLRDPRWLATDHTVLWRESGAPPNEIADYWEPGYQLRSLAPFSERRLSNNGNGSSISHDVSPDGRQAVLMSLPGGTQPLIWNQEIKTLRSLPVDLAVWRYKKGPLYRFLPFNANWHPSGNQILFWDGTWVFLYDLAANSGCEIDVHDWSPLFPSIHETVWSPNGRYLLLQLSESPPYSALHGPFDLVMILDTYTGEAVQYSLDAPASNFAWASDSQMVAFTRGTGQKSSGFTLYGIYLLNIHSGDYQQILPADDLEVVHAAFSPDGMQLAFYCQTLPLDEFAFDDYRICISQISTNQ